MAKGETKQSRGFEKVDADLRGLVESFREVLGRVGDHEVVPYLPWVGDVKGKREFSPKEVRAYSMAFHLLNIVEENTANQIRRARERSEGLAGWPGLWGRHLRDLKAAGVSEDVLLRVMPFVQVEPVLTAHPTEAKRASTLEHHRELYLRLVQRENTMWTPSEAREIDRQVNGLLERLWRTGEVYLTKPTIEAERAGLEHYLRSIFPEALKRLDRRFLDAWEDAGFDPGAFLDIERLPKVTFGTWVGGDRDGHPFVTPQVTEETFQEFRLQAVLLLKDALEALRGKLSLSSILQPAPERLLNAIADQWDLIGDRARKLVDRNPFEPWRQYLSLLIERLPVVHTPGGTGPELSTNFFFGYRFADDLEGDLRVLRDSLIEVGAQRIVELEVNPILRLCEVFGFHLMKLDVRQNSAFHDLAIGQILGALGVEDAGNYGAWSEERRLEVLERELLSGEKRLRRFESPGPEADAAVGAYRVVARQCRRYGRRGVGALILSMTRSVSDLLGVYFLAREAGLLLDSPEGPLCPVPVVPLFETVDDLKRAPGVLGQFLEHPVTMRSLYWRHANERSRRRPDIYGEPPLAYLGWPVQQVMIGYSDSNKDRGIFASQWALHEAQRELTALGQQRRVRIRFFHGRGGTISRGAGPTDRFLDALPEGALGLDLRMTEQGETIANKYANLVTATYNLELLVAGTCRFSLLRNGNKALVANEPTLDFLADESGRVYDALLGTEGFIEFYRQATPIDALESSRIGSRPARRTGAQSLKDLRAIPWVFSWAQSRFFLSGWYGVGSALRALECRSPGDFEVLCRSLSETPFVNYVMANVEAGLFSADREVMEVYAGLVEKTAVRERFMERIRAEYELTHRMLGCVLKGELSARRPNLAFTLERRREALRTLHGQQVALLREWRERLHAGDQVAADKLLPDLLLTINAIASGLKTTG